MVIAVDFDGTCVTHEYPDVGKSIGAEYVLKALTDAGHQLILYSMRSDEEDGVLADAVEWFQDNGIPLYGVNENPSQKSWTHSPKVYANLYIDDAALGCPKLSDASFDARAFVDWKCIALWLYHVGILSEDVYNDVDRKISAIPIYQKVYPEDTTNDNENKD